MCVYIYAPIYISSIDMLGILYTCTCALIPLHFFLPAYMCIFVYTCIRMHVQMYTYARYIYVYTSMNIYGSH